VSVRVQENISLTVSLFIICRISVDVQDRDHHVMDVNSKLNSQLVDLQTTLRYV
jgi:hypothetical protein